MSNSVQFDADADIYGRGLQCNIMMIRDMNKYYFLSSKPGDHI